ncbi:MAG: hypothetical protein LLG14_23025 [Nocardiaceae bacterium]|nr:hypothetical protein [Nocardiaceae bacterium]
MTGAYIEAAAGKTRLANSVLRLFKAGFTPSPTTPLSAFVEQECDFDGYAAKTIAAWGDPVLAGQGYAIYAPTQTFLWAHVADDVGNQVGGAFLVTSGGDLYSYTVFDPTRPAQGPYQAIITTPTQVYLAG